MSERFSTLFKVTGNLYRSGSPLIISAGALLKDNQTSKVLVQLKFKSISDKPIKAVKISLNTFDITNVPVGRKVEYQYLDLNVKRNDEFGSKEAIPLSLDTIRSYSVKIINVVYSDGSLWEASDDAEWLPLAAQQKLSIVLKDDELVTQYLIETSDKSNYIPAESNDLWMCSCGAINHKNEAKCCACKCSFGILNKNLDIPILTEKKKIRIEKNKIAEKEKIEKAKFAEEKRKSRNKKLAIRISVIAVSIILVATAFVVINNNIIIPNNKYKEAVDYYNIKKYTEAVELLTELGNFKDSADIMNECNYQNALTLMDKKQYANALEIFSKLDNYKDSVSLIDESNYAYAEEYLYKGELNSAYGLYMNLYMKLPDYKNVQERIAQIKPYLSMSGRWKEVESIVSSNGFCDVKVVFDESNAVFLNLGSFGKLRLIGNETEKTSLPSGNEYYFSFSDSYLNLNFNFVDGRIDTTTYQRESVY
ncbi:MAG: hypothetical protein CVU91_10475 [Firmicutes bacterium HGW-Firmicutes-16]|nr:MAG: hypothetical protein CVU91_10475 [Firmicutes bacterium HGW-Firmicutes-16]